MSFKPWEVELLAYSENPDGQRARTYRVVMPRSILAEGNTHRMLSRNAASSRAVPTKLLIERVMTQPYIPDWTKKGKGMSGEKMTEAEAERKTFRWLRGRDRAIASTLETATDKDFGVKDIQSMSYEEIAAIMDDAHNAPHKQDINRIIEPWLFMDWIVSGTDWANFSFQRVHRGAHPAFQRVAYPMTKLGFTETPNKLEWGGRHLPFVSSNDFNIIIDFFIGGGIEAVNMGLLQISAARCGRVSYLKTDQCNIERDLKWFQDHILNNLDLGEPPHVSPAEHPCIAEPGRWGNFNGFKQLRQMIPGENRTEYTIENLNRYEEEQGLPLTQAA